MKRLHVFYSGHVQGVGFRYAAEETALRFDLAGWARNRRDGRVELVAEGEEAALLGFLAAMKNGPLGGNIFDVAVEWGEATGEFEEFSIRPTE